MGFITGTLLFAGGAAFGGVVAAKATVIIISEELQKTLENWKPQRQKNPHLSYKNYFDRTTDIDSIIFEKRTDAALVLDKMDEIIAEYGFASVADLCDLTGVTSLYTDAKFGWSDLKTAGIHRVRDGYVLKLPKATHIDR